MLFVSAGHNKNGVKIDLGASANGYHEAILTSEFRNLVANELTKLGAKFITDRDDERLAEYLERIKTGTGSVVLEFHFDASNNPKATGTTSVVGADADRLDIAFAKEVSNIVSIVLGIKNRGVMNEKDSHRGRLGLMRETGIVCLVELGFLTNINDMNFYQARKIILAKEIAKILIRYDALI